MRVKISAPSETGIGLVIGITDIELRLCCDFRFLHFSATIESRIKIKIPLQLGHLAFVCFSLAGISVSLIAFSQLRMSAAALNVDRVLPGAVLDTKSHPIPSLVKSVAVASGKSCGPGSSCYPCIWVLDGPDILTSTP
jgi:hypothetical protein